MQVLGGRDLRSHGAPLPTATRPGSQTSRTRRPGRATTTTESGRQRCGAGRPPATSLPSAPPTAP
eukprot:5843098-Alexandrium_andersonii.AAC.1